jgi:ABC-type uncharacterized transport system fused permease/ATPase subunit
VRFSHGAKFGVNLVDMLDIFIAAVVIYMIVGALVEWALFFHALEVLAFYKVKEDSKLKKILIKLWPLVGAIAWPAILWAIRRSDRSKVDQ